MQFDRRNATGKAGERFVETYVEDTLGLAYRKVGDPDLGIDGEIEFLNRQRETTGGFLKVQVKTTDASLKGKARIRVPFDEKHLEYFDTLTVPPILAVVSRADNKIWWKPILHKETYRGLHGGLAIVLDRKTDEMTRASGRFLRMIGERSNAMIARYLLEEIEEQLTDMDELEKEVSIDLGVMDAWAERLRGIDQTMQDVRCLLKYERRYSTEITAIEDRDVRVRARIGERKGTFEQWGVAYLLTERRWGDSD